MASPREQLANRITDWLSERSNVFTAPYGVLQGFQDREDGRGKARTITFGIARLLDATLVVWNEKRLDFTSSATEGNWVTFNSEQEFYDFCTSTFGSEKMIR